MKYLILICVLVACRNASEKATPIYVDTKLDSLIEASDSTNYKLAKADSLTALTVQSYLAIRSEVKELREEKKARLDELGQRYPNYESIKYLDTSYIRLNKLNALLAQKDFEIARLRRQISKDSIAHSRSPIKNGILEKDYVVPDNKSLIINIRNQGATSIWVMPYSKKAEKEMKSYDVACSEAKTKFSKFKAQQALYYNGMYFVNGLPAGKYIVKLCAYYGNYAIVEKKDTFTEINILAQ